MTSLDLGRTPLKTLKIAALAACTSLVIAVPAVAKPPVGGPPGQAKKNEGSTATAVAPPAASGACPDRTFANVFAAFHDTALYTLAPDGDFEAGAAGWTLGG